MTPSPALASPEPVSHAESVTNQVPRKSRVLTSSAVRIPRFSPEAPRLVAKPQLWFAPRQANPLRCNRIRFGNPAVDFIAKELFSNMEKFRRRWRKPTKSERALSRQYQQQKFCTGRFWPLRRRASKDDLSKRVPDTVRLYLAGKIDQWWIRQAERPVFLMNVTPPKSVALLKLPLARRSSWNLISLTRPLTPLHLLLQKAGRLGVNRLRSAWL